MSARRCSQVPAGGTRTTSSQSVAPLKTAASPPASGISSLRSAGPSSSRGRMRLAAFSTSAFLGPRLAWPCSQELRRLSRVASANCQ